jgi:hypothetical protein
MTVERRGTRKWVSTVALKFCNSSVQQEHTLSPVKNNCSDSTTFMTSVTDLRHFDRTPVRPKRRVVVPSEPRIPLVPFGT